MEERRRVESVKEELLLKVTNTIEENKMLDESNVVVVALSGGPDSICLLHALYSLKDKYNIKLYAAHINHMLRDEAADGDELTCRSFCEKLGVDFFCLKADVGAISKEKGISTEMAGREVRYRFFEEVKEKVGANRIAIAHNMNDQAETMLMRLMRGTGIEGLIGIKPVRDEVFIRPIINVSRAEIETYCSVNQLPVRIDESNFETIYSRNKVRLELIPYIEKNFNEDIVTTLNRMGELIKRDEEYIQQNATKVFLKYCYIREEKVIIYKGAFDSHSSIISRVIRRALMETKGDINNIQSIHIENIISLQKLDTGKVINLPENIIARNVYGDIVVSKNNLNENRENFDLQLSYGKNSINNLGINIIIKKMKKEGVNLKGRENIKYFSDENVKDITLRFRKQGDRFIPFGMKGSKKLKDVFIDMKIPREERDNIPLLCFDGDISWILGYKISDKYRVNNKTSNIIEVSIERQENHE